MSRFRGAGEAEKCVRERHLSVTLQRRFQGHLSAPTRGQALSRQEAVMSQINRTPERESGKEHGGIGYVLLWFLGIPIPLLILFALLRGCA